MALVLLVLVLPEDFILTDFVLEQAKVERILLLEIDGHIHQAINNILDNNKRRVLVRQ